MSRSPWHPPMLPPPHSNQPLSHRCPTGFGYRNGGLGAGVFPEARAQPGAWGCWVGWGGGFWAQGLLLPLTFSFFFQGSLGLMAFGMMSWTQGTPCRGWGKGCPGAGQESAGSLAGYEKAAVVCPNVAAPAPGGNGKKRWGSRGNPSKGGGDQAEWVRDSETLEGLGHPECTTPVGRGPKPALLLQVRPGPRGALPGPPSSPGGPT